MKNVLTTTLLASAAALALSACGGKSDSADSSRNAETSAPVEDVVARTPASSIDFGTDDAKFANDGECDDNRFTGEGMTETDLLEQDVKSDATDCRAAYEAGTIELK